MLRSLSKGKNSFPSFSFAALRFDPAGDLFWWAGLRVECWCCSLCDSFAQATDVVVCFGAVVCELLIFFVAVLLSFPVVVCFCLWRLVVLFLADRARIKKTPFSFFFLPSFVGSHLFSFKIKIGTALCLQARQKMDKQQEEESSKNQNFEKAFSFVVASSFSPPETNTSSKIFEY